MPTLNPAFSQNFKEGMNNSILHRIRKNIPIHIFFWVLSFYILLKIFVRGNEIESIDILYTLLFQITIAPFAYLSLWSKPRIIEPRNWLLYSLVTLVLIIAGTAFNIYFFNTLIDLVLPGYYFISYYSQIEIIQFYFGHFFILTLLQFSLEWFKLNRERREMDQVEKEKVKFEMKALLTQINPHFLFNTLNNLYSMVIDKNTQSGEYILKLADVLRYVLYQSKKDEIPIEHEVKLLQDYISLNELREENANIQFKINTKAKWQIAPMLLLPLIENAFKHSASGGKEIGISLATDENHLKFEVANNWIKTDNVLEIESKGIGNENIKRRLEILYPSNHKFETELEEHKFRASLELWK